jgi:hypothetical protein
MIAQLITDAAPANHTLAYALFGIGVGLEAISSRRGLILNGIDTRSSTAYVQLTLNAGNTFVTDVLNIATMTSCCLLISRAVQSPR